MRQSRKVVVKQQRSRKSFDTMKRLRNTFNKGLFMLTTTAVASTMIKTTETKAQTVASSLQGTQSNFLNLITSDAARIAAANDLYASVMIAQAILESGWGTSTLSQAPYYNLFGIKGTATQNTVTMETLEDSGNGTYYVSNENFKDYDSYAESLADYAAVLTGNHDTSSWRYNYYLGARMSQTNSYQEATAYLTGRYATDTAYATKLNSLIEQHNLTAYDAQASTNQSTTTQTTTVTTTVSPATDGYIVQAGDTYWSLARRFNVSVTQLQQLNQATTGNLYVGQTIKVPSSTDTTTTTQTNTVVTPTVTTTTTNTTTPTVTTTTNTTTVQPTTSQSTYTVVAGDTYWAIAKRYGVSAERLMALNGTSSSQLSVGQVVNVPSSQQTATQTNTVATTTPTVTTTTTNTTTPTVTTTTNTTTVQPTTSQSTYTVVAGDTYWAIAQRYGVSVERLMALNGTSSSQLSVGQVVNVPSSQQTATQTNTVATTTPTVTITTNTTTVQPTTSQSTYTVVAGDTLWSIANRHGVSVAQLLQANQLSNVAVIYPGQQLVITNQASQPSTVVNTVVEESVTTETVVTPVSSTNQRQYTVVAGDTLYSLARRLGVQLEQLIANNGGSTALSVGQVLYY